VDVLSDIARVVPDLSERLIMRYRILQRIELHQPVGRRTLASLERISERVLRAETDVLREQGLLAIGPLGMSVTAGGARVLEHLQAVVERLDGRNELTTALERSLCIASAAVAQGDADRDADAVRAMGRLASERLLRLAEPPCTIAVTGGSTMAALADVMPQQGGARTIAVVPARGGLGERVEYLSNSVASRLADRLGGTYRMFHVPETLSADTAARLALEPAVRDVVTQLRAADIVVHGIGDALTMARRRGLSPDVVEELRQRAAVAEAFGYYFNAAGEIVYAMHTIGLRLEDLAHIRHIVAVAGGAHKAKAIQAAARAYRIDFLITDEGAARLLCQDESAAAVTAPM
jgi:central glycolytic genes regulator